MLTKNSHMNPIWKEEVDSVTDYINSVAGSWNIQRPEN